MNTVKRITRIQFGTVLEPAFILPVIVRHHVSSVEKHVLHCDIPLSCFQIEMPATREYIISYMFPVMLKGLEPAKSQRKCLERQLVRKVETGIGIYQNIVHKSLNLS